MFSSCSSSGVRSYFYSTPPESIFAAVFTVKETADCIIIKPPAKDTNIEDFNIGKVINRRLFLKDSY